jgi:diacylglycerol kinase family enzyme
MAHIVLIANPSASRVTPEVVAAVERVLAERGRVETSLTEGRGHAVVLAEEASESADLVFVLSGDGGYNEAVNGLSGDVPIGFLPGGGTSVLPRALGLPRDPVSAATGLHAVRRISLGRVNGRRFTVSGGLGLDADLVRRVDRRGRGSDGRRPGDTAYVRELLGLLVERRGAFTPSLTVEGLGRAAFALVANCDPYSYLGRVPLHVAPEARFELGLDLVAPIRVAPAEVARILWWLLARPAQSRSADVLYVHDADELRIVCDAPLPLQVDGEDLGDVTEAVFEAEREALAVLVPGRGRGY